MAGRDLVVSAQTGSGKTVAFGLAMAGKLLGEAERLDRGAEPVALIIAPTRELALQVQSELVWLYADAGARVVTCVGGMDARTEARALRSGAHIVVGTPGRLRDHLERRQLDLGKLRSIVLDEADEMLDLGFREDLEFILDATPAERQTLLFSATMPREIETLAQRYQRDAARISTVRRDEQHADIEYQAMRVAPFDVENGVVNVLRFHEARAALVFCATREAVKRMHARLLERGFSAVALSGELTQSERTQALQALRDGRARVLVATDVAARGLDLPDLALVIHSDLPNDGETLLHRSGRTGRAGKKGLCVLIVPYNRRRKAEVLLSAARITPSWMAPPTADEIRARDQERFLADAMFTNPASEDELTLVQALQAGRTSEEIALALTRMQIARLPAPEDLAKDSGPSQRSGKPEFGNDRFAQRNDRFRQRDGDAANDDNGPRPPRTPRRVDDRPMVWFRLNIGRDRNADPRWLVPLICKAGDITKAEIGAIKIFDRDTRFQILAERADAFDETARHNKGKEGIITRAGPQRSDEAPAAATAPSSPTAERSQSASANPPVVASASVPAVTATNAEPKFEPRQEAKQEAKHETKHRPRRDQPHRDKPAWRERKPHDAPAAGARPAGTWKKEPWKDGARPAPQKFADRKAGTGSRGDFKPGGKPSWKDRKPHDAAPNAPQAPRRFDKPASPHSQSGAGERRSSEAGPGASGQGGKPSWRERKPSSNSDSRGTAGKPAHHSAPARHVERNADDGKPVPARYAGKPTWAERKQYRAGGPSPWAKGGSKFSPQSQKPRSATGAGSRGNGGAGGGSNGGESARPASKYAHKKKHRTDATPQ
jgi:ATP-dependent RNA helicase DeaD